MITGQNTLLSSDKDYLEMLMFKVAKMKFHGQAFYARKMNADKNLYENSKTELNEFLQLLKKRGYNYDRFHNTEAKQTELKL